jgi:hypothetical protein
MRLGTSNHDFRERRLKQAFEGRFVRGGRETAIRFLDDLTEPALFLAATRLEVQLLDAIPKSTNTRGNF